jgi:2-polyprenyl-6-hydroxyphenyl methylase/3-demethylubiquinone-9 3-methyltransferase
MTIAELAAPAFDEARVDRFAFGKNWQNFLGGLNEARIAGARADLVKWLGTDNLQGASVLDIGSGSGVHSYCLHQLGAARLVSFDYDENSVQVTRSLHQAAGAPESWTVQQGSILDTGFVRSLGTFDLVYSWGVLHHTGQMWQAIANAATCVMPGGYLFIAIYAKGPLYPAHLALKQRYHDATISGKRKMEFDWILDQYTHLARRGLNPESWWNQGLERGMDPYIDLVDWLGGLPYEVATLPELTEFLGALNIDVLTKHQEMEGGCHILIAQRRPVAQ